MNGPRPGMPGGARTGSGSGVRVDADRERAAVTGGGLPSASRLSHSPPTVAVIQSKPPQVRYDSAGYAAKD
ncbi:hypothetical protein [Streptomyces niphimycinicus]|uniref:hypothetical protein n=1 Tax=Streptomyces niphimycinicus TaxID=2842201 RepID=UPI0035586771